MDRSDYIAIGALVVAIVALAWRIWEWRLKQARVKVKIEEGFRNFEKGKLDGVIIKIINHGKESIKISSVGLKNSGGESMSLKVSVVPEKFYYEKDILEIFGDNGLPCNLKGGDNYKVFMRRKILSSYPVQIPLVAFCEDATGKIYYSKKYKIVQKEDSPVPDHFLYERPESSPFV